MSHNHHPAKSTGPQLRLVGENLPAPTDDLTVDHIGSDDPAETSLRLIDSMSRRIDVLAHELRLDGKSEGDRPRAA